LSVAFGGRVAEEIIFNRISTGAANDIKQATDIAQKMIRSWGMSKEIGPHSFAKDDEHIFLGREIAQHRDYSEETARKIDQEINNLIKKTYNCAKNTLNENLDILHALADRLLEKETVLGKELDELILSMKPGFEFPSKTAVDEKTDENVHVENEEDTAEIKTETETETESEQPSS